MEIVGTDKINFVVFVQELKEILLVDSIFSEKTKRPYL